MLSLLTYREDRKTKSVRIDETQAAAIRGLLAKGEDKAGITIGNLTLRVGSVVSISADVGTVSKEACKELRRRLASAAAGCPSCKGVGFVELYFAGAVELPRHAPKCDVRMRPCGCQTRTKASSGLGPYDFDWSHADDEDQSNRFGR